MVTPIDRAEANRVLAAARRARHEADLLAATVAVAAIHRPVKAETLPAFNAAGRLLHAAREAERSAIAVANQAALGYAGAQFEV